MSDTFEKVRSLVSRLSGVPAGRSGAWRLLIWPIRGPLFDPSPFESVELGRIAKAIDTGHWIEP